MAVEVHGTLLLLRRGPLAERWDRSAIGQSDPPLIGSCGAAERAAIETIAEWKPVRILTSDLRRARSTAERLARKLQVECAIRRDLRGRRFGTWQGRYWSDIVAEDGERAVPFLSNFCEGVPPKGESLNMVSRRAVKATLAEMRRHQRQVVCYVGHAAVIRALMSHALHQPLEAFQRCQLDPFGLTVIRFQGDASVISLMNHPAAGQRPGGLPS